jgi:putative glutamine amidotransferase
MIEQNKKPLIGITGAEIFNKDEPWAPATHGQSRLFVSAVLHAGGVPIIIPLMHDEAALHQIYDTCDAILFAGGNDPSPELFGETPDKTVTDVSNIRDSVEMALMRWSLEDDKAILGICRGMEILNIARGGSLYQDIPQDFPEAQDHNQSNAKKDIEHIAHILTIDTNSKLAVILQTDSIGTNTHHHQAIKKLGDNLQAVAWAEDGIVEAIEDNSKPYIIGVQSHPESLEAKAVTEWQRLFTAFVVQAAKQATK